MKIVIASTGILSELPINTVIVALDHDHPEHTMMFHCYKCAQTISQIRGTVIGMVPGLIPSNQVPIVERCRGCKEMYVFQTHQKHPPIKIHLTLVAPRTPSLMHCLVCRSPMQIYSATHHPSGFVCTCGALYALDDVLSLL